MEILDDLREAIQIKAFQAFQDSNSDPVRARIDRTVDEIIGVSGFHNPRELLAKEPIVTYDPIR